MSILKEQNSQVMESGRESKFPKLSVQNCSAIGFDDAKTLDDSKLLTKKLCGPNFLLTKWKNKLG